MEINYFDIVVGAIILLLGLKGILNGFFKELFGLIGIVGGVFVASRTRDEVGGYLSDAIFHFENQSAVSFTGFLVSLAAFWLLMVAVGILFQKLSKVSGLGPVDKILGFVFGMSKFFLIASVIAFALNNIKALRPSIESNMQNSVLFPILVASGSYIMKIDPVEEIANVNENIENVNNAIKEKTQEFAEEQIGEKISEINTTVHNAVKEINTTQEK